MSYPYTSSQSQLFAGQPGKSWHFFVEATAVRGRPALIRKIIKNGGMVVNSAREADILLAENNTKEALELFEAWRGDKIILSTRWVARCLHEGVFLGVDREWGGCEFTRELLLQSIIVSDDASEAEEEQESQHPKHSRRTVSSSQPFKTSPARSVPEPGPSSSSRTPRTVSLSQSRKLSSKVEQVVQQTPNSTANTHNSPSQSSGNGFLPPPPPSQNSTFPMDTSLQASPSPTQTTIQQQQQALFASMFGNMLQPTQQPLSPDLFSPLAQYSNFPQIPPILAPFQHLFSAVNPLSLQSRPTELSEQPGSGNSGSQLRGFGVPSGSTQESSTRPTPEDVDTDLVSDTASIRSEGEVELSISSGRRAKGQAMSNSSSDHDVQTAIRSNPPRSKATAPKKLTGMFVDEQGVPRKFFVMVDIKNRKDLLKIIRKHNGAIVSQMKDAEFIILNTRSNQFQKTLNMLPRHKIAISPSWLEECEIMGKMTEIAPHVIDITSGIGPGALRRKIIEVKTHRFMPEECESEEDSPERVRQPKTLNTALPSAHTQEGKMTSSRGGSQSPLPPTNIVSTALGNLFTADDRTWFFKYARFKLKRDPDMSHAALMDAIATKAPHHSKRSWATALRTKWGDEMETLRREIAPRRQTNKPLLSPSSSATLQDPQTELLYPDSSPLRAPHQPSLSLPDSSAPTSSQTESIFTSPLKRKEHPTDGQPGEVVLDQQNKKLKPPQGEVIDVDAYLGGLVTHV